MIHLKVWQNISLKYLKMKNLFFLIAILIKLTVLAQITDTLVFKRNFHLKCYKNEKQINAKELKSILYTNQESKLFYQKFVFQHKIAPIYVLPFVANTINKSRKEIIFPNKINLLDAITYALVFFGTYKVLHSYKYLKRSVAVYNKSLQVY